MTVSLPRGLSPMLATTGDLPVSGVWSYEVKWDGVRVLSWLPGDGTLHMESRRGNDITPRYPELKALAAQLTRPAILDGEVVAFDETGTPSFGVLQHRMHLADVAEVRRRMLTTPVALVLFDILWLDEGSTMRAPYEERRAMLEDLALSGPNWQTPVRHDDGAQLLAATLDRGLEGVVAKRLGSLYEPGRRSRSWVKVKNVRRQEVVIGGWLPSSGNREGRIGALLAGVYEGDRLVFSGRIGTGFSEATLADLKRRLAPLERLASPFTPAPRLPQAHWVEPVLVAEAGFGEWTSGHTMRHPRFLGLRDDKAPHDVVREH